MNRRPKEVVPCHLLNCGLETRVTCSECITRICCSVTYHITVKNNCNCRVRCATLHVDLPEALAYECGSLEIRHHHTQENNHDVETLNEIPLGDLDEGEEVIVTFRATVMNNTRYIRTRAACSCFTCNCCTPEHHFFQGNCHLLQVCGCCCRD